MKAKIEKYEYKVMFFDIKKCFLNYYFLLENHCLGLWALMPYASVLRWAPSSVTRRGGHRQRQLLRLRRRCCRRRHLPLSRSFFFSLESVCILFPHLAAPHSPSTAFYLVLPSRFAASTPIFMLLVVRHAGVLSPHQKALGRVAVPAAL